MLLPFYTGHRHVTTKGDIHICENLLVKTRHTPYKLPTHTYLGDGRWAYSPGGVGLQDRMDTTLHTHYCTSTAYSNSDPQRMIRYRKSSTKTAQNQHRDRHYSGSGPRKIEEHSKEEIYATFQIQSGRAKYVRSTLTTHGMGRLYRRFEFVPLSSPFRTCAAINPVYMPLVIPW